MTERVDTHTYSLAELHEAAHEFEMRCSSQDEDCARFFVNWLERLHEAKAVRSFGIGELVEYKLGLGMWERWVEARVLARDPSSFYLIELDSDYSRRCRWVGAKRLRQHPNHGLCVNPAVSPEHIAEGMMRNSRLVTDAMRTRARGVGWV